MNYQLLSQLRHGNHIQSIKVRVFRKWFGINFRKHQLNTFELLLIDEQVFNGKLYIKFNIFFIILHLTWQILNFFYFNYAFYIQHNHSIYHLFGEC